MDNGFRKDDWRTGVGKTPENPATVRHLGLNLSNQETNSKKGINGEHKKAGWDESYLLKVLNF